MVEFFRVYDDFVKELIPHYAELSDVHSLLQKHGFCVLNAAKVIQWIGCSKDELKDLSSDWADMPHDKYLKDGGRYRRRRHSSFIFEDNTLTQVPHRAHWQSLDYNALHGGMERWFEPVLDTTIAKSAWSKILYKLAQTATQLSAPIQKTWCIEAHQFRIDTTDGIGRPTPEGAHRDGVNFVAVFMVDRHDIKGGETRVFDANGPHGERFTLSQPWSLVLLDDARMIHESTPIQPLNKPGYRDTLVVTLSEDYFQNALATRP
jgi:hypothetical protein